MAFNEARLLATVERGAKWMPRFNTGLQRQFNGAVRTNRNWSQSLDRFDVAYAFRRMVATQAQESVRSIIAAFHAQGGRADPFRFRCVHNFQLTDVSLGTGDGVQTAFQAREPYVFGSVTYFKTVKKLVSGTTTLKVNGTPVSATPDITTGIITADVAPAGATSVTATFQRDYPVAFESDELPIELFRYSNEQVSVASIPSIFLEERRL